MLTRSVLDITLLVSQLLQSKSIDICDGFHLTESLKALVITRRQDVDEFHNKWYKNTGILTEEINIAETIPRVVGTQIRRSNTPAESVSAKIISKLKSSNLKIDKPKQNNKKSKFKKLN